MKKDVENYCKTCPICQMSKKPKKECGNTKLKEAEETEVAALKETRNSMDCQQLLDAT